jgi:hypothetical protein
MVEVKRIVYSPPAILIMAPYRLGCGFEASGDYVLSRAQGPNCSLQFTIQVAQVLAADIFQTYYSEH